MVWGASQDGESELGRDQDQPWFPVTVQARNAARGDFDEAPRVLSSYVSEPSAGHIGDERQHSGDGEDQGGH